jgi:hypothetical protein
MAESGGADPQTDYIMQLSYLPLFRYRSLNFYRREEVRTR